MKRGDRLWVLHNDEWRIGRIHSSGTCMAAVSLGGGVVGRVPYSHDVLDAMQSLRAATEAVAKARDAVVDAARTFRAAVWTDRDQEERDVDDAVTRLIGAERAEAEARARLEALR